MRKYCYKVIETESDDYPIGFRFCTSNKLHDNRKTRKTVILSDKDANYFKLELEKVNDCD